MSDDLSAPAGLPKLIRHFIDGEFVETSTGATFESLNPATNRPYAEVARGDAQDVSKAVAAARRAFEDGPWPRLANRARARLLNKIADGIEARDEQIAQWEAWDTGLPISQARQQAHRAAENFRFFADVIVAGHEEAFSNSGQLGYVLRKPIGVAGLITPWNTPFMLETWKTAPAIASGCTAVLKPAEFSPLSSNILMEVMAQADLPPGAINCVQGIGEEAGAALVAHPDVSLVSFTGETTTGKMIGAVAAQQLKGVSMELGGKSPCIIFADADIDRAVDGALFGVFSLNGERCTAGSRVLIEQSIYDEFVEAYAARARQIRVGLPTEETTEIGALIHPEHYDRVMSYVRVGIEEGAKLLAGGKRPEHLPNGNFLEATVFADVTKSMRIFQEEIFGPVVCLTPFRDEAEAIELANATSYGLAAYIWTSNLRRAHRVAAQVESGMLWINSHNVRDLRTPFGGVKSSGIGREGGQRSIDFYTEPHIVHVALSDVQVARFGASLQ
ncbi:MAG: 5-carboxymethyl-2-hydroxymuconate semialdehyde dehydrogenase [Acidimicrobiales bacterium]